MKKLVIFGARNFAEIAHYYFTHDSDYAVSAFCVDGEHLSEPNFKGTPIVPFEEITKSHPPADYDMFVAIGIHRVNKSRAEAVDRAQCRGYRLASFLSSRADVASDLVLEPNCMVMERAGIQPFVRIGRNSIIWSASRIGFHTQVGEHCWIVSALFGESCVVGDYSFIGLGATIAPTVRVGSANIIGAGALITGDTKDREVYRAKGDEPARATSDQVWGD